MDLTIHGGVVTGSEILITDSAGQLFAEPKQFDAISGDIYKYYRTLWPCWVSYVAYQVCDVTILQYKIVITQ